MHTPSGVNKPSGWRATVSALVMVTIGGMSVLACGKSHPVNATEGNGGAGFQDTCTDTGATRPCHVLVSKSGGYSQCMAGTQTCDGTLWGACAAGGVMGTTYGAALTSSIPQGVGGKPKAVRDGVTAGIHLLDDPTPPKPTASLCTADPCDPYCFGWDDTGKSGEAPPPIPVGDYTMLPGGAQVNLTNACHTGTMSSYAGECQYDTCCFQNGKACVPFGSTNAGRCVEPPSGDSFGALGQPGGGNCAAGPDFTAGVACDFVAETYVEICNRGGADSTAKLNVGFKNGGNPYQWPVNSPNGGCALDFSVIPGGLPKNTCGALNIAQATWNGAALGVNCSSMGATPAARQGNMSGDRPIFLNTTAAFTSTGVTNIGVAECNSSNNWSFSHHLPCLLPPSNNVFAPISTLTPNANTNPCSIGTTQADAQKCQYDTCCSGITCVDWNSALPGVLGGMCDPTNVLGTANLVAIVGNATSVGNCTANPDYTISAGCNVPNGDNTDRHFQVCNRGAVSSPAVGLLHVGFGADGTSARSYPFTAQRECILDLSMIGALAANTCGDLNAVQAQFNGASTGVNCSGGGFANPDERNDFFDGTDRAVRINGHPNSTGDGDNTLIECDGANNWSFRQQGLDCSSGTVPLPPPPRPYTYTAVCEPGFRPRWKWLSYKLAPGAGDVLFSAVTALTDPQTGVLGAPGGAVTLADPPIAPTFTQCDYVTNNPPCPVNMGDPDPGQPARKFTTLQSVSDTLILTVTPVGQTFATNWGLSYDCIPYE